MNEPVKIALNAERNGVELRFKDKPSLEVRTLLKEKRFRFSESGSDPRWYAKQSVETLTFAKNIVTVLGAPQTQPSKPAPVTAPALEFV